MRWLRYYYQPMIQVASLAMLALGGIWMWCIPVAIFFLTTYIDQLSPDHEEAEEPSIYSDAPLFLASGLVLLISIEFVIIATSTLASGSGWSLHAGFVGDVVEPQPLWALAGGALGVGMLLAAAFNIGHEFSHRMNNKAQLLIGQVICALSLHACFPIEHVYGHHRNVGTRLDPTTARRKESFWMFLPRSFTGTYRNAFRIEQTRAARHAGVMRIVKNRAIHGIVLQISLFLAAFLLGGWIGLATFTLTVLIALLIMELFQYVGHYGLVRVPGTQVRAAHAWELSGTGSSSFTVNLTCHSAHHISGDKPYWQLRLTHQAPTLPFGPFPVLAIALVPPLYFKLTDPALREWDKQLATPDERALAAAMLAGKREADSSGSLQVLS